MTHSKQGRWGCGRGSSLNTREELSYYGHKLSQLSDVNDDNIWGVGAFGGVGNTLEVQGRGWVVGDQKIQLL